MYPHVYYTATGTSSAGRELAPLLGRVANAAQRARSASARARDARARRSKWGLQEIHASSDWVERIKRVQHDGGHGDRSGIEAREISRVRVRIAELIGERTLARMDLVHTVIKILVSLFW